MRHSYLSLSILALLSACTQAPAPVDYRGSYYYGQDGAVGNNGMEMPKYSDRNRAELPQEQAANYVSPVHDYGVAAEIGGVSESDLPPPPALQPSPPPQQAVDAYNSGQQSTVIEPALNQTPPPGSGYYDYKAKAAVPPINEVQSVTVSQTAKPDPNASQDVDYYSQEAAEAAGSASAQFIWPVRGDVLTPYSASAKGLTIRAMKGDPVRASDDGTVQNVGPLGELGMSVTLRHNGGWTSQYGHLGDTVVRLGDQVVRGQLVGFVGPSTGGSQAKVYFSLSQNGSPADPRALLIED
jgi:murein DD-endopeptidase MepM/ murein hydrolase activator NlpD